MRVRARARSAAAATSRRHRLARCTKSRDDVLRVQDADDVVERAAVDRQPAVRARGDDAAAPRSNGVAASTAASRARGTISCRAVRRPSRSARCSRTCSCGSSRPPSRLSAMSSSISSGECTCRWPVVGTRMQLAGAGRRCRSGTRSTTRRARSDHCIGRTVKSAVSVGSWSASDFGTSSPTIIASVVRTSRTATAAVDCAASGSRPAKRSSERRERAARATPGRRRRGSGCESVMPTCEAAM